MDKNALEIIAKIVNRAEAMNIGHGSFFTKILDMDHANRQFNLRLDDMLIADDFDFAHDFIGIQENIDRESGIVGNFFLPRFAGNEQEVVG